jgi:hypothetical protein
VKGREFNMRFEVLINGKKVCTAGIRDYGVLSTTITRVKRNPNTVDKSKPKNIEEFLQELTEITLLA